MNIYKFKTNINCNGCISTVTPFMNNENINFWEADISSPDKILTVKTDKLMPEDIVQILKTAGYNAELI
ncbi:MAG: hypothetical protein HUU47_09780 [Bacteroidetes bacterium]|nr:hypothetical protein [Bacteroidota bacterium]